AVRVRAWREARRLTKASREGARPETPVADEIVSLWLAGQARQIRRPPGRPGIVWFGRRRCWRASPPGGPPHAISRQATPPARRAPSLPGPTLGRGPPGHAPHRRYPAG